MLSWALSLSLSLAVVIQHFRVKREFAPISIQCISQLTEFPRLVNTKDIVYICIKNVIWIKKEIWIKENICIYLFYGIWVMPWVFLFSYGRIKKHTYVLADLANPRHTLWHGIIAHSTQCSSGFQFISYVSMQIWTISMIICLFLFFTFSLFVFFFISFVFLFVEPIVKRYSSRDFCLNTFMNFKICLSRVPLSLSRSLSFRLPLACSTRSMINLNLSVKQVNSAHCQPTWLYPCNRMCDKFICIHPRSIEIFGSLRGPL